MWAAYRTLIKLTVLVGWVATILSGSPVRIARRLIRRWAHKGLHRLMRRGGL